MSFSAERFFVSQAYVSNEFDVIVLHKSYNVLCF